MTTTVNPRSQDSAVRAGWTTFAGVVFVIGGFAYLMWGWAALADATSWGNAHPLADSTFVGPLEFWGWFAILGAIVLLSASVLLFKGHEAGRVTGIVLAALSATFWLFAMPTFPLFALAVMAIDIVVLYGLIVHWEKADA
jgi:hypothetical protein